MAVIHDDSVTMGNEPVEIDIVETFHSFASAQDPEYLVNAFFENDRPPL